jgi:hypothetical protein
MNDFSSDRLGARLSARAATSERPAMNFEQTVN